MIYMYSNGKQNLFANVTHNPVAAKNTVKSRYYEHRINDFFRFTNILKIPARLPIYFQCKNISEQRISVQCIFQNNVHNLFARLYARNISITNLVKSSSTATLT